MKKNFKKVMVIVVFFLTITMVCFINKISINNENNNTIVIAARKYFQDNYEGYNQVTLNTLIDEKYILKKELTKEEIQNKDSIVVNSILTSNEIEPEIKVSYTSTEDTYTNSIKIDNYYIDLITSTDANDTNFSSYVGTDNEIIYQITNNSETSSRFELLVTGDNIENNIGKVFVFRAEVRTRQNEGSGKNPLGGMLISHNRISSNSWGYSRENSFNSNEDWSEWKTIDVVAVPDYDYQKEISDTSGALLRLSLSLGGTSSAEYVKGEAEFKNFEIINAETESEKLEKSEEELLILESKNKKIKFVSYLDERKEYEMTDDLIQERVNILEDVYEFYASIVGNTGRSKSLMYPYKGRQLVLLQTGVLQYGYAGLAGNPIRFTYDKKPDDGDGISFYEDEEAYFTNNILNWFDWGILHEMSHVFDGVLTTEDDLISNNINGYGKWKFNSELWANMKIFYALLDGLVTIEDGVNSRDYNAQLKLFENTYNDYFGVKKEYTHDALHFLILDAAKSTASLPDLENFKLLHKWYNDSEISINDNEAKLIYFLLKLDEFFKIDFVKGLSESDINLIKQGGNIISATEENKDSIIETTNDDYVFVGDDKNIFESNGSVNDIYYTSSNEKIAIIDTEGNIKAKEVGEVTFTAQSYFNDYIYEEKILNIIDYNFKIEEVIREELTDDKFKIPIKLTNISNQSENDFSIKVLKSDVDVTDEFVITDYIKANNYVEIEKKSLNTENGIYKVEITYDLLTYDTTIEITNSNPTIEVGDITYKSSNVYINDNKIYDKFGGTITIPLTVFNLSDNKFDVEITKNGLIQNFTVQTNPIVNNTSLIQVTIPNSSQDGIYTVKIYNNEVEVTKEFTVYKFIEPTGVTFKYGNVELNKIILLENDNIDIIGKITNEEEATIKTITYKIVDTSIATISNQRIVAKESGNTKLVAIIGDKEFELDLEVIKIPNITFDNVIYESNVPGNSEIDNYFGGKIEIERTTENMTNDMIITKEPNVLGSCISYDYPLENKVSINIVGSCGLSGGESTQLSAGTYSYNETLFINDTKGTTKEYTFDYNISKYVALGSIMAPSSVVYAKVGKYSIKSIYFEPTKATNKNVEYVVHLGSEDVISIDNTTGSLTAKKAGVAKYDVVSIYNPDISDTVTVVINPIIKDIKEEDITIKSNYYQNKIYEGYGGEITAKIITENIPNNVDLNVKFYKDDIEQNDMTNILDLTKTKVSDNSLEIKLYPNSQLKKGIYKVELSYPEAESKSFEFEVIEPKFIDKIIADDITLFVGEEIDLNYQIEPSDAYNQNLEYIIKNVDQSLTASVAIINDGKIKGNHVGNAQLTIKALDGSNKSITVNVEVVERVVSLKNVEIIPNKIYNNELSKLFNVDGGKIESYLTLSNIDYNSLEPSLIKTDDDNRINLIDDNKVNVYLNNDTNILTLDISNNALEPGEYIFKLVGENYSSNEIKFNINQYNKVEKLDIKYNNESIENINLFINRSITLDGVVNENATNKDVEWVVESNNCDYESNGNKVKVIGESVGVCDVILKSVDKNSDGNILKKSIRINVIDGNSLSVSSIYSSPIGNDIVDVKYGGTITNTIQFNNLKEGSNLTVEVYDGNKLLGMDYIEKNVMLLNNMSGVISLNIKPDVFNKPNEYTPLKELIVQYKYTLDDIDNTEVIQKYKVVLGEYNPIKKINISKSSLNLNVGEFSNISNLISFEPSKTTNKKVVYSSSNSSIISVDSNGKIKAIKEGSAVITVKSDENSNIKSTISVTVEKNDYLEFSNKVNIYNESGSKYLKGFNANNTYKDLMNNIDTNLNVVLKESNGTKVTSNSSILKTGMKLSVGNNTYDVVIKGDMSGDGKMSITDLSQMRYHLAQAKGKIKSGAYKQAGDMNDKDGVTITDLSQMRKKLAGGN